MPGGDVEFPQGTVTLAFTDIEGSTGLWEKLGAGFQSHLNRHNEILRECIGANRGFEVKTEGDAFMVAFNHAADGVGFAADVQRRLATHPWPDAVGDLRVRVGVHTGEPILQRDPGGRVDYFGPPVNRAARICSAGHGGQVLLSDATRSAAGVNCDGLLLSDLGEHRLRGLERAERLWQMLPAELHEREFPPPRTQSIAHTNLPVGGDAFIGRTQDMARLRDCLLSNARVVTLCGAPGCGKSRLSQRAGRDLLPEFPGGVWYVDLQDAQDAESVAESIASVIGIARGGDAIQAVETALALRERTLLILDSFEHLAPSAAGTVGRWSNTANACWLVVSRSLLSVSGERVVEIGPLGAPARKLRKISVDQAREHDAVKLFEARAREADPAFTLDESNALDIAAICAELEGIPLALELAARRVRILKPAQIHKQLTGRTTRKTSFLVAQKGVPERQRTLFGAIDWSFRLLADHERDALLQATQFSGGFLLDAAESVIDLTKYDAPPVFEVIQSLRDKSLLRTTDDGLELRFTSWVSIREFCEHRWARDIDEDSRQAFQARHARHFADYAEHWDERIRSTDAVEASNRVLSDMDNMLQGFDWAGRHDPALAGRILKFAWRGLRASGAGSLFTSRARELLDARNNLPQTLRADLLMQLAQTLHDASELADSDRIFQQAIACGVETDLFNARAHAFRGELLGSRGNPGEAKAEMQSSIDLLRRAQAFPELVDTICRLGVAFYSQGDFRAALEYFEEAVAIARSREDLPGIAGARARMGDALSELGESNDALKCYDEAEGLFRDLNDARGTLQVTANRASLRRNMGHSNAALQDLRDAEEIVRDMGDRRILAIICGNLGNVLLNLGDTDGALKSFDESAGLARQIQSYGSLCNALGNRGNALHRKRDRAGALQSFREAEKIARDIGDRHAVSVNVGNRGMIHGALGELDQAVACFEEAVAIAREIGSKGTAAGHLCNVGELLVENGRHEEGVNCYEEAEELSREIGDTRNAALALLNRGDVELRRKRYEGALSICRRARDELHETGFSLGEAVALGNMAEALLRLDQPTEALPHLHATLEILQRTGGQGSSYWFSNLVRLAEAESALGNHAAAVQAAERAWDAGIGLGVESVGKLETGVRTKAEIVRRLLERG